MFPPEDAPPAARLSRWLDWWLAPRWRALLTWVVLAALMNWVVVDLITFNRFADATVLYLDTLSRVIHSSLPRSLWSVAYWGTVLLFNCWFEPLVLRLNLVRGLAWIGLRIAPELLAIVLKPQHHSDLIARLVIVAASALAVLVLHGWRSRPWMSVIGTVLLLGVDYYLVLAFQRPRLEGAVVALPYAVALLYGTRLLRPDERARREG